MLDSFPANGCDKLNKNHRNRNLLHRLKRWGYSSAATVLVTSEFNVLQQSQVHASGQGIFYRDRLWLPVLHICASVHAEFGHNGKRVVLGQRALPVSVSRTATCCQPEWQ